MCIKFCTHITTMEQYNVLSMINHRSGQTTLPFIPPEVLRDKVWEYLTYPHERGGKFVNIYNKCIVALPKLTIYPGVRIIHGFTNLSLNFNLVKFIYVIYHSINKPDSYITIHEYTAIRIRLPSHPSNKRLRYFRNAYMERVCQ